MRIQVVAGVVVVGVLGAAVGVHLHHGKRTLESRADSRRRGPSTHRASPVELAVRNRVAREEVAKIRARNNALAPAVSGTEWVSLGPTDAPKEYNYFEIASVDSGRPNNIVVDPRDPNVVYVAVSGGGVWKTYDFLSAVPSWSPT